MENKLLPCPFCGSEPLMVMDYDLYKVGCPWELCPSNTACGNERTAAKAWNTRHERTCIPKDKGKHLSGTDCPAWECSECGELFEAGVNFCSNCGARVIS